MSYWPPMLKSRDKKTRDAKMRTHQQWLTYRELELVWAQQPEPKRRILPVLSVLSGLWNRLIATLSTSDQPCIWQTLDRQSQIWWNVYNPRTRQLIQFASEQELLTWIDESFLSH